MSLGFQASLVADIVHARDFDNAKQWDRCIAVYIGPWLGEEDGLKFAETVRSHFQVIDQVNNSNSLFLVTTLKTYVSG